MEETYGLVDVGARGVADGGEDDGVVKGKAVERNLGGGQ